MMPSRLSIPALKVLGLCVLVGIAFYLIYLFVTPGVYRAGYWGGYEEGYYDGYWDGLLAEWHDAYEMGYREGYEAGYKKGG